MSITQAQNGNFADSNSSQTPSQYHQNISSLFVDKINDILNITDPNEMDTRISKNTVNIIKIFQFFQNNFYDGISVSKDEVDKLIHSLKFVDTLNLFMTNQAISTLIRYMNQIYDLVAVANGMESKELILKQIKYTEMTVIFFKKKYFKSLFFGDGKVLGKEIEHNLELVNKNGKFDQKLFKQLQNLFYVVQGKLDENKKNELQQKMNEMKSLSIKIKKQRYNNIISNQSTSKYYDDYNDYSDYKNYSNVSGNLFDYNDNFYENEQNYYDDNSNNEYNSGYYQDRYFYRHPYRSGYHRKYYENEEKEVEISSSVGKEEKPKESGDIEIIQSVVTNSNTGNSSGNNSNSTSTNKNYYGGNDYYHQGPVPKSPQNGQNNQISIDKNNTSGNSAIGSSSSNNIYNASGFKKKIITKKNMKQRGITLVEVPLPESIAKESNNNNNNSEIQNEKTSTPKAEEKTETPQGMNMDDTEVITTVVRNPRQEKHSKYYHTSSGYKGNTYSKNQYYGNYNSNYYHGSRDGYYHGGYQGNQGPNTGAESSGYYNKRSSLQSKKYYGRSNSKPKHDFVEIEDIQPSGMNGETKKEGNISKKDGIMRKPDLVEIQDNNPIEVQEQNNQVSNENIDKNKEPMNQNNDENDDIIVEDVKSEDKEKEEDLKNDVDKVDLEKILEENKKDISDDNQHNQPINEDDNQLLPLEKNIEDQDDKVNEIDFHQTFVPSNNEGDGPGLKGNLSDNIPEYFEEEENEEEGQESSDSVDNEVLNAQFKEFIKESLSPDGKTYNDDDNYYLKDQNVSKNNKVVFEDDEENQTDSNGGNDSDELENKILKAREILDHVPDNKEINDDPIINTDNPMKGMINEDININELLPVINQLTIPPIDNNNIDIKQNIEIDNQNETKPPEIADNKAPELKKIEENVENHPQEETKDEISQQQVPQMKNEINESQHEEIRKDNNINNNNMQPFNNSEIHSANKYKDSVKSIDPKILSTIKNKLSEDFNNQENKNQTQTQMQGYMGYQSYNQNYNQMLNPAFITMLKSYQRQFSNNKIPLQSILTNDYHNFFYRGRDANIHREYATLKSQENEGSIVIKNNLMNFENKILIPIYQRINYNVNKKRGIYYYTFIRYKKLIQRTLVKDKIIKKVKPYGSYMNNFLIDSGDIDICIVPKCGILEFAQYLNKIKDEIITKSMGEYKLSHHTERYLLLKILDSQTKFIVDITVHTMLPIQNTNLIRLYSLYDQRFHILGLYVKHWAKINKIHGAADNFLSSYALLLMIIHFLQKIVEPKVLPNLQKIDPKKIQDYEFSYNGRTIKTNLYYEEDAMKINEYMNRINGGKENKETATSLLIKFFEYYSYFFDSEQKISINKELSETMKQNPDNIAFSIEDPFDLQHNPGKSMTINSVQYNKFITSMKKEINFILNGEYVKRLDKIISGGNSNNTNTGINEKSNN